MRKLTLLLQILVTCFAWYLIGSFVAADFNIGTWPWAGRYLIGCCMVITAFGLSIFTYLHVPKK